MTHATLACLALVLAAGPTSAAPLWRDASDMLPGREAPGHSMNARAFDADGDGDIDLIVAMEYRANRLLLNDGRGGFSAATGALPSSRRDSEEIALLDADRDGDLDVAVANEDDLRPELYLNQGDGRFADASVRVAQRVKANAVVAFDADADGRDDLFFGGDKVSVLFMGDGRGGFRDESLARLPDTFGGTQDVAVGDVDGDRDLDLVLGNEDRNQIYLNDGRGMFALAPPDRLARPPAPEETRDAELFDVDGDGDLDLFFANVALWNPRAAPQNRVLLNDGAGRFADATAAWWPHGPEATLSALPIDLDGDGRLDLIMTTRATNLAGPTFDGAVRAFRNTGATFAPTDWIPPGPGTNGFDVTAADFDGDGKADLFVSGRAGPDRLLLTRAAPSRTEP